MKADDPVILLVDDNTCVETLMRTVFRRAGFAQPLQFAADGEEALAYLQGDGRYSDRMEFPMPTVVLMDLKMPGMNGFEILEWIRQQQALRRIPVYILSASSRQEDIEKAYDLGANTYLVKPGNLDGLMRMAEGLMGWIKISCFAPLNQGTEDRGCTSRLGSGGSGNAA